tara:strand:+ start:69 stop:359 length:291 start_codon:yes stop_codon:yes gene_type:complete
MERKKTFKLIRLKLNLKKLFIFDLIKRKIAISKLGFLLFMKSKRLLLNNSFLEGKEFIIYFFATSALLFFLIKIFYTFYLNNPSFHMFIQSKGIFL